jgi:hypothetical protein
MVDGISTDDGRRDVPRHRLAWPLRQQRPGHHQGHTAESAVRLFGWNVFNTLQDVIAIETHEQWPAAHAQPFAVTKDGQLMMGYGDENAPALAADPLSLDQVIERT